ncbi:hypothetical protein D9Q98_005756 [Chlorella vulgaris]|uniref:Alkyl transferase n=1 Tax=Chlorella vulgaris TaxID=3077 RepID=A0A9D4TMG5_CHLVU|nr:hypothetical protein D9Q98_005756 [Chlorella vulgaris]
MPATASKNRWGHRATAAAAGGGGSNGSDGATTRLEVGSSSSRNGSAPGLGTQAGAESTPPPRELLPGHLAAIMDGNGRWAAARGLPPVFGYQAGIDALRTVIHCCLDWGVPCLTVYGFSMENWRRPALEVDALLALIERALAAEVASLAARGVRLRFIGELGMLPPSLQRQIRSAELATGDNSRLHLTVALSYSGRQDLTLAVQEIARLSATGELRPCDITPALIAQHLATQQLPTQMQQPDLVIRTSGERRLSNFLLWESAYSELYFSDVFWPDFGEGELAAALREYAARDRRYGGRPSSINSADSSDTSTG